MISPTISHLFGWLIGYILEHIFQFSGAQSTRKKGVCQYAQEKHALFLLYCPCCCKQRITAWSLFGIAPQHAHDRQYLSILSTFRSTVTGRSGLLSWACHQERDSSYSDDGTLYSSKQRTGERETEICKRVEESLILKSLNKISNV
jgi:hypothetical protein